MGKRCIGRTWSQEGKNICLAFDINDQGDIVGCYFNMMEDGWPIDISLCLWTNEGLSDLSEIIAPDSPTLGINNLGHIRGDIMTENGQRAYILRGEELTELGVLWIDEYSFGFSIGNYINEYDQKGFSL